MEYGLNLRNPAGTTHLFNPRAVALGAAAPALPTYLGRVGSLEAKPTAFVHRVVESIESLRIRPRFRSQECRRSFRSLRKCQCSTEVADLRTAKGVISTPEFDNPCTTISEHDAETTLEARVYAIEMFVPAVTVPESGLGS